MSFLTSAVDPLKHNARKRHKPDKRCISAAAANSNTPINERNENWRNKMFSSDSWADLTKKR